MANKKDYLGAKQFNKSVSGLFDKVISQMPLIAEAALSEITDRALEYAVNNIEIAFKMADHSEHTPELTKKLSGGARNTESILDETGELKRSIYLVDKLISSELVIAVLGSDLEYSVYHEEGFSARIPNVPSTKNVPARPFMKPAIDKAIKDSFRYGLESRVRKAMSAAMSKKSWKKFF